MDKNTGKIKKKITSFAVTLLVALTVLTFFALSINGDTANAETTSTPIVSASPDASAAPNASVSPNVSARPTATVKPTESAVSKEELDKKSYLTEKDLDKLKISFEQSTYAVIEDNIVELNVNTNIPFKFMTLKYQTTHYYASIVQNILNKTKVEVRGNIEGESYITAVAAVEYCDDKGVSLGSKTLTAQTTVKVLGIKDITLNVGEQCTYDFTKYNTYKDMTYLLSNTAAATITNEGVLTAMSAGFTDIYLTDGKGTIIKAGSVTVKSIGTSFNETTVNRAIGSSVYLLSLNNIPNGYTVQWNSSNTSIVNVDQLGNITPVGVGTAIITANLVSSAGVKIPYTCNVNITNPKLDISKSNLAKDCDLSIKINGTYGKAEWKSLNDKIASVYSTNYYSYSDANSLTQESPAATIHANKKGTVSITVLIDGITLTCKVTVTNPQLVKGFFVLSKGTKCTIKLSGTNSASKVKYVTVNKKIAAVSGSGVVRTKKYGYCNINVLVDGATLNASINIGSKKGVKAVMNALKVEGATYSQARRMQKGYYDCSSLVWRSFAPLGSYYGNRFYAPVAASEASYCVNHKKTISKSYVYKLNKLRPGDVFFFSGKKNGRYKNIYHTAIYMGQEGTTYLGKTYSYGKIVHANGIKVTQSPMYNQSNISVIGRVFK